MSFSSFPGRHSPSRQAALRALESFIKMPVSEKPAFLEKKQELLLSDSVEQILTERIKHIEASSGSQAAISLKFYRWLLRRARHQEIAATCEELRYLTDPKYRESFKALLKCFFRPESLREGRRQLEQNPQLLDPALDRALEAITTLIVENPDIFDKEHDVTTPAHLEELERHWDYLRLLMQVRRDAYRRGGSAASIAEACVNYFGGLALDAPPWLVDGEKEFYNLAEQGASEKQLTLLDKLIERAQKEDTQIAPETLAELRIRLAGGIVDRNLNKSGQQADAAYKKVMGLLKEVEPVYTFERYPYRFALAQKLAGDAHLQLLEGDRSQNLEDAIHSYTEALRIFSPEVSPGWWAETQIRLSNAYRDRMAGSRDENMEEAIKSAEAVLTVLALQNSPARWASAQHALGNAYFFRIKGEKAANVERAIMHYHEALRGIQRDPNRRSHAMAYFSLGNCYNKRFEGPPEDNIEQAIAYYKAAEKEIPGEDYPLDRAAIQVGLGQAYLGRLRGNRRDNIEKAIEYFNNALEIFQFHAATKEQAAVYQNLGTAYCERIAGAHSENIEQAISHLEQAEQFCSRETDSYQYALLQFTLGNIYSDRMEGYRQANLLLAGNYYRAALEEWQQSAFPHEWALARGHLGSIYNLLEDKGEAIVCYKDALKHFTRERYPHDWAGLQHNLGVAYRNLTTGDRNENIRRAIQHLQAAQEVRTRQVYPTEWAMLQEVLGAAYLQRSDRERQENVQEALGCYESALQVYESNSDAGRQRSVLMRIGNIEAEGGHWEAALERFKRAANIENALAQLAAGAMARDLIRGETVDASTRVAYTLVRLGDYKNAAIALEEGRARDLAEGLNMDTVDLDKITDERRRKHFIEARTQLCIAMKTVNMPSSAQEAVPGGRQEPDEAAQRQREALQRQLHLKATETCHQAQHNFDMIVEEIRAAKDPEHFLEDNVEASTILNAAAHIGPQHALVYLVATPWGGFALAACGVREGASEKERFFVVDLPQLTLHQIGELLGTRFPDDSGAFRGGYAYAQRAGGFDLLIPWLRQGNTFRQAATLLHEHCLAHQYSSTLDCAAQEVLAALSSASLVDMPVDADAILRGKIAPAIRPLINKFRETFLHHELQHCFSTLGHIALSPLMEALQQRGITSLTLIPCGWLAAFPLAAVLLEGGHSVGNIMPTSIAPSARSLQQEARDSRLRTGVYALGNPGGDLMWGEAEVLAVRKIAESLQSEQLKGGQFWVQQNAKYTHLVEALEKGLVVDISTHGRFDIEDFRESALILAQKQYLSLGELLSHSVDLRGMRLLILSACETAVLDMEGAVNEVRSLASGVLQSGAQAVLASLWPVSDYATYLLIVYFAQHWLPNMERTSPASALAKAQQWLRTVTWGTLRQWDVMPATANSYRPKPDDVREIVHRDARHPDSDECPFASPLYWAGFQLTGW